jgi:hypothetical protein
VISDIIIVTHRMLTDAMNVIYGSHKLYIFDHL